MTSTGLHTVMISGDTPEVFSANFAWWAEKLGYVHMSNILPPPIAAASAAAPKPEPQPSVAEPAPQPLKRGRGRPPKAAAAPVELPKDEVNDLFDSEPPAAETLPEKKPATVDDAKQAGRDLITKKGTLALREVLNEFTVDKVADLKPEQLEGFIERCVALTPKEQCVS